MKIYWLILGVLTVWRITHFLFAEDGPWDVVIRLRRWAGEGFWGKLLDCFYCLSVWVAAPLGFLLGENWRERVLLWPALSAAAILLERVSNPVVKEPLARFIEDPAEEENDVMLREKARADAAGEASPNHRAEG